MRITKCDRCHKIIKNKQNDVSIMVSRPWKQLELCERCAGPVIKLLQKQGLVEIKAP